MGILRNRIVALALAICLVIGMSALADEADTFSVEGVERTADIAYLDDGDTDHLLDVYQPEGVAEATPVIVEIHGGGFIGGTKETNMAHSGVYAQAGYMVVTPNYTHLPKGDFRTVIQDIFAVLHWVEANAEQYNFDMNHVFISGDSAGAAISALTAAVLTSSSVRDYYQVELPSFQVKGFVLTCPTVDILSIRDDLGADGYLGFKAQTIGEDILMNDELMNMAHVYNHLDPGTYPEVYIITTPTDELFYHMAVDFDAALTEKGISHQYHVYEGQENTLGHVFNVEHVEYSESIQANADAIAYLDSLCAE